MKELPGVLASVASTMARWLNSPTSRLTPVRICSNNSPRVLYKSDEYSCVASWRPRTHRRIHELQQRPSLVAQTRVCGTQSDSKYLVPRLTVQRTAVDRGERGFSYHNPKLFRRALRDFEGATCFETSQSPVKNLASLNRTRGNEGRAESKSGTCMFHDREEGTTCWQSRLLVSLQNI